MNRLGRAFRIAGLAAPRSARALATKYKRMPPVHLLELVRAICGTNTFAQVKHLFVLVLENRSFDHVFGLSQMTGADVVTGEPTSVRGVSPGLPPQLDSAGTSFSIVPTAPSLKFALKGDLGHEFKNVKRQLCSVANAGAPYSGADSEIDNSGFVLDLEILIAQRKKDDEAGKDAAVNDALHCFTPASLPVLTALAKEFVVCDNWFSSVPGPTFPNRMFLHAGTSDGITESPGTGDLLTNALFTGYEFANGHVFDRLDDKDLPWYVYVGDKLFNQTVLMDGIAVTDLSDRDDFAEDVADPDFDGAYVFIEPNYDPLNDYVDGNSMHPLNDPSKAEALVKKVYESLRKAPCWERSALVITFDEHGGFFDHVRPPRKPAFAPGDNAGHTPQQSFDFTRLGVRVPAIIVSPLVLKNGIDHTLYDHTSILATLRARFGLKSLTKRDAAAAPFSHVFQTSARADTPPTLPNPAPAVMAAKAALVSAEGAPLDDAVPLSARPESVQTFVLAAAVADRKVRGAGSEPAIAAEVATLRTVGDVRRYATRVRARVALHPPIRRPPRRRKSP
jgi:phospholipase C